MSALQKNLALAKEAMDYASGFVLKGSTQLASNAFGKEGINSINFAVNGMRENANQEINWLHIDEGLFSLLSTVYNTKKYFLANCGELALLALWYLESEHDLGNISVGVYHIKGGDHVFLVIGSGEGAVVCDPWSSSFYPLSEYKTKLKNYYYGSDGLNHVEDFDPKRHAIEPDTSVISGRLIRYFNTSEKKLEMVKHFKVAANALINDCINQLLLSIEKTAKSNPSKMVADLNRVRKLNQLFEMIDVRLLSLDQNNYNCLKTYDALTDELDGIKGQIRQIISPVVDQPVSLTSACQSYAEFLQERFAVAADTNPTALLQAGAKVLAQIQSLCHQKVVSPARLVNILLATQKVVENPTAANQSAYAKLSQEEQQGAKGVLFFANNAGRKMLADLMMQVNGEVCLHLNAVPLESVGFN